MVVGGVLAVVLVVAGALVGPAPAAQALRLSNWSQAWGNDGDGELGNGTTPLAQPSPVSVVGLQGIRQVAAGPDSKTSLAVLWDGTVWAWGGNSVGELGNGTVVPSSVPVQVPGLSGIVQVAAGAYHSVALGSDGRVWTWGWNYYGQLGDGTTVMQRLSPVLVPGLSGVTQISAGGAHTLALDSLGRVWSWGLGTSGQLGNGDRRSSTTPVLVGPLLSMKMTQVSAGSTSSFAVGPGGTVWAWGDNSTGELGDGTTTDRAVPTSISTSPGGVSQVSSGWGHTLALGSDGTVWAWGDNSHGQLGDGGATAHYAPAPVPGLGGYIVRRVAAGASHSLALTSTGVVMAWGSNRFGQLGDGTTTDRLSPVAVTGFAGWATQISAGWDYSLAIADHWPPG